MPTANTCQYIYFPNDMNCPSELKCRVTCSPKYCKTFHTFSLFVNYRLISTSDNLKINNRKTICSDPIKEFD